MPNEPSGRPARVLVVDDDDDIRELSVHLLRGEGYDVEDAPTGTAGMDRLRAGPLPDVVLLDIAMPQKSGWECLTEIRADPRLRELRVILFTAKAGDEDRLRGRAAGADAYLSKPFDVDRLLELVRGMAEPRRSAG